MQGSIAIGILEVDHCLRQRYEEAGSGNTWSARSDGQVQWSVPILVPHVGKSGQE